MLLNIVFMVLGAGLFVAGFVWMQREKDDRESLQIYGWAAYLGAALLAVGIGGSVGESGEGAGAVLYFLAWINFSSGV